MFPITVFHLHCFDPDCLLTMRLMRSKGYEYDLHPNNTSTFCFRTEAMETIPNNVELT